MDVLGFISQPWHWSISGVMIVVIMFLLIYTGRRFGVSTSFETICSAGGAGRFIEHFRYNWKEQSWLLLFVVGAMIGGFISTQFLASPEPVNISSATIRDLSELGIEAPGKALIPLDIFNWDNLSTMNGIVIMIVGGFLIGFGTRWARGCTSGHAITGLSQLQLPSLIAVIGFFIGGLIITFGLYPILFK